MFDNPAGRIINTTSGSNGIAILDSDLFGSGNSQNSDLITPSLDLSSYGSVTLSFQHYFYFYTGSSAKFYYSINGGSSWTVLQIWTANTSNPSTYTQDLSSQVAGQPNVRFKWNYTGTWGYYWAVDDISITGTQAGVWTGATSSDWNTPTNWNNNAVPSATTTVTIPSSAPNWPVYSGALTLGTNCKSISFPGTNSQLIINGNLTVPFGSSILMAGNSNLSVGGSWSNKGTFSHGTGTVAFTGSSNASVSGFVTSDQVITNYKWSTFDAGMIPLTDSTAGPAGDNGYADAALPFTFRYMGNNFNNIRISTNGWASLNLTGTTANNNSYLFNTTNPNATLAPWFDDLNADGTGSVCYNTTGASPGRIFSVEWKRVLTYRNNATSRISFQLKLYETTNVIEFHYGNLEAGSHSTSESASIGIEDVTGGSGHFIEATTGSTSTGVTNLTSSANWPVVNYRFTPPPLECTFNNLTVNNPGGNLNFNINTNLKGNFTVLPGGSFSVTGGKTLNVQGTEIK